MVCPTCNAWTACLESRHRQPRGAPVNTNAVYRRYQCANGHRFSTLETVTRVIKPKAKHDK